MAVDIFPITSSGPLELSEARYISGAASEVEPERYEPYLFALQFCGEKEVLDVASGEGYGTALLGIVAQRVFGIDVSPDLVTLASLNYQNQRVRFTASDYATIPFSTGSVDVAISFEALKHVDDQGKFLREIRRVLRPGGVLVISSPNAQVDKILATGPNRSRDNEQRAGEFRATVSNHFPHCRFFGQRLGTSLPTNFIAVASEKVLPEIHHGLFDERSFVRELDHLLEKRAMVIQQTGQLLRATAANRDTLFHQLRSRESEFVEVQTQLSRLSGELQARDDELAHSQALIAGVYSSWSWRLTLPLRLLQKIALRIKHRSVPVIDRLGIGRLVAHLLNALEGVGRSDAGSTQIAGMEHEAELKILQQSGLFDEQFYREANPDVDTDEMSLLKHYLLVGAFEGRRPNRLFDSAYYLENCTDAFKAGVNPALHYFLTGAAKGYDPSAEFDTSYYVETNPDVRTSEINPLVHFMRFGAQEGRFPRRECYERDLQGLNRLAAARYRQDKLAYRPLVSVLMRTYNTNPIHLEAAVQSVIDQAYSNWELRIVDDNSSNSATLKALERIGNLDKRVRLTRKVDQCGNSGARNCALLEASGEYVAMLGDEDELAFDALYEVVLLLNSDRTTDVVYTDEEYISPECGVTTRLFKPDWSPSLLRGVMYVGHLLLVRRSLALEAGAFEPAFDAIEEFEFTLRISERTRKIRHIPMALYRCNRILERAGHSDTAARSAEQLQAAAVQAHLRRLGLDGLARPSPFHPGRIIIEPGDRAPQTTLDLFLFSGSRPVAAGKFTISALARTGLQPARIAVPAASFGLEIIGKPDGDLIFDEAWTSLTEAERLSRFIAESSAEFVLVMAVDVAIETDGWLEMLTIVMQEREVAAVCPAVLSADGLIAHAGLLVGFDASLRPAMRGQEPQGDGYQGSLSCAREISAAWADVVLLRRSVVASLLPAKPIYSTTDFLVADLTLQATKAGLRAVCAPYVRARQAARAEGDEARRLDALLFEDHWVANSVVDPFCNPYTFAKDGEYSSPKEFSAQRKTSSS